MPAEIKWTDAYKAIRNDGYTIVEARFGLGSLLDGELELPQADNAERVITEAELDRAREAARLYRESNEDA